MSEQTQPGNRSTQITGDNYGQIVSGDHNTVTMIINAERAGITEDDRDQMRALLDELRTMIKSDVPEEEKETAQKEARALSQEVESDEPDAGKIKRAIEWIGKKLPAMAAWTNKAILSPFISKAMDAAGTAIVKGMMGGM